MKQNTIFRMFIAILSIVLFLSVNQPVKASSSGTSYVTKNSIVYKNKNGVMRLYQTKGADLRNGSERNFEHVIYLYGTFTNKSNKSISPIDFFNSHFKAFQISSNKSHELNINIITFSPTEYTNFLGNNGYDYTRPHKTVRFAVSDEFAQHFYVGQKISIHTYNNIYNASLKQKSFKLDGIYDAQAIEDDEDQKIYSYITEKSIKKKKEKEHREIAEKEKAKIGNKKFYQTANKYSVYWGNNKDEYKLINRIFTGVNAYIKDFGYLNMLIARTYDGKIHLTLYMTNKTNNTFNVEELLNKYFDITVPGSNDKLSWKMDDMKKRQFIKPKKESATTFISTNNENYSNVNNVMVKVKDGLSTNMRVVQQRVL